jgi:RNA polymerase sigma-70 factor (ECF subfamily)
VERPDYRGKKAVAIAVRAHSSPARTVESDAGRLFEEHSERIFGYCLRFLGSRSDAEDAMQTTFLQAHRALERGVVPELEYPWLHSIAKNVCRGQLRTLSRRGPLASDLDLDALPAPPGHELELRELRSELRNALAALPEAQRRAVVLREWQGLESHEIASELGIGTTAAYALLTRARRSLARALSATGTRPVLGVDFVSALAKLKALLAGGTAKVAVTTLAVGTVAIGGVAVERAIVDRDAPPPSAPTTTLEASASNAWEAAPTDRLTSARPRPTRPAATMKKAAVGSTTSRPSAGSSPTAPAASPQDPSSGAPGTTAAGGESPAPPSPPASSYPPLHAAPVAPPPLEIPLVDDVVEDVVDPLLEDPLAVVPPLDVELPLDEVAAPLSDLEEDVENVLESPLPDVTLPDPKPLLP